MVAERNIPFKQDAIVHALEVPLSMTMSSDDYGLPYLVLL